MKKQNGFWKEFGEKIKTIFSEETFIKVKNWIRAWVGRRIELKIKNLFKKNKSLIYSPKTGFEYIAYEDLAPKDQIRNAEEYFAALDWAFNNSNVTNMAIAGPYGSGKSSIIKSYIKKHPELKFVNISLATFKKSEKQTKQILDDKNQKNVEDLTSTMEENHKKGNEEKYQDTQFDADLEAEILKQLFYKVNYKKIPQSRYRKLHSIKIFSVICKILIVLILGVGISIFAVSDIWTYISVLLKRAEENLAISRTPVLLIFVTLVVLLISCVIYFVWKFFTRVSVKEIHVAEHAKITTENKAEGESSIFNKNMDEIVYFFEATKYNVVFIEDLDRFENIEIFAKLRELNIILNRYEKIKTRIVFVYAIKDDMFIGKDRTKFFDYILPVIPIINATNSEEKLLAKIEKSKKTNMTVNISSEYITLISPYIDDMRVLTNIYNEFITYKKTLQEKQNLNLLDERMFSMILFKNLYPKDFSDLQAECGIVKESFDFQKNIIAIKKEENEKKVKGLHDEVILVNNEVLKNVKEIKVAMLYHMTGNLGVFKSFYSSGKGKRYSFQEIMREDFNLENLCEYGTIYYYDGNGYEKTRDFNWKEFFSGKNNYMIRYNLLLEGKNKTLKKIYSLIDEYNSQSNKLNGLSLKEMLTYYDESEILPQSVCQNRLLVFLLREGYIDETYSNYMNYFHANSITSSDKNFILSIRNRQAESFAYNLSKVEQIVQRLALHEFKQEEILNFDLLDYLLEYEYNSIKCNYVMEQIANDSRININFIDGYLERTLKIELFIQKLGEKCKNIWNLIYSDSFLSWQRKSKYFNLICRYLSINTISRLNNIQKNLQIYFLKDINILKNTAMIPLEKMKELIQLCSVRFKKLSINGVRAELLDWIFENSYYDITLNMLENIITHKAPNLIKELNYKNYTTILELNYQPLLNYIDNKMNQYIGAIVLNLPNNTQESITAVLKMIEKGTVVENSVKIIQKEAVLLNSLEKCNFTYLVKSGGLKIVWDTWIIEKKLLPSWENVVLYWNNLGISNILINFIEENTEVLALEKPKTEFDEAMTKDFIKVKMNVQCFERLLEKMPLKSFDLSFSSIDEEHMQVLIRQKYFDITPERINELRKAHSKLLPEFIETNQKQIFKNLDTYTFESTEIMALINSPVLSEEEKIRLVSRLNPEEFTKEIAEFLSKTNKNIEKSLFESAWEVLDEVGKRRLFLNQIENLSKEEISNKMSSLIEEYALFSDRSRKHEEKLSNKKENLKLAKHLKNINYITSYKEKGDKIVCWIKKA